MGCVSSRKASKQAEEGHATVVNGNSDLAEAKPTITDTVSPTGPDIATAIALNNLGLGMDQMDAKQTTIRNAVGSLKTLMEALEEQANHASQSRSQTLRQASQRSQNAIANGQVSNRSKNLGTLDETLDLDEQETEGYNKSKYYALITGCSRGIGFGLVNELVCNKNNQYYVFATCRNPNNATKLQQLAKDYPNNLSIVQLDVIDNELIENAFKQVKDILCANNAVLDILINNAGISTDNHPYEFVTERESGVGSAASQSNMLKVYETNVVGPMLIMQKFISLMGNGIDSDEYNEARRVINISSILSSIANANVTVAGRGNLMHTVSYRCSKAALNMLNTIWAVTEGIERNIIFTSINPGWVSTELGSGHGAMEPPTTVQQSCQGIINVMETMKFDTHNGSFYDFEGNQVLW